MKEYMLEVCVDSVESALAAAKAGAKRLELCGSLVIGGTTPGSCLYETIREYSNIPIHALIRPRFGDFCYTELEFAVMKKEIAMFRELGAQGVVIGMLTPSGDLDISHMEQLIKEAGTMNVTLHRAFDMCRDPFASMEQAIQLGIGAILTSGQKNSSMEGAKLLAELRKEAAGRIEILIGSGVCAEAIPKLYEQTGATQYHMSGKKVLDSRMQYRKEEVSMGTASLDEYMIWQTDEEEIVKAVSVLEQLGL